MKSVKLFDLLQLNLGSVAIETLSPVYPGEFDPAGLEKGSHVIQVRRENRRSVAVPNTVLS